MKSLRFLLSLQKDNRQFAIIGLGRFGRAVCTTLHGMGYEVLGTDMNEKLVNQALVQKIASHAIQLDSTDVSALKEAGILEFETVIVAIGNYLEESIITTLNLKEAGVKHVVAKASSEVHGKLLNRGGGRHVVFPEYEAGAALAYSLTKPSILDRFDIDPDHSIVEVLVPEEFHNRTIAELGLRNEYGINLLAVSNGDKFEISPAPEQKLYKGSAIIVIGSNENIKRLPI